MTIGGKILAALEPLGYPVVPDRYTGSESTYLTFNYSANGGLFADDRPLFDLYLIQVHLFAPFGWDGGLLRKQIKQRLFAEGFTWPAETDVGNEDFSAASQGQHIVFACQMEESTEEEPAQ
ncbi:hypothetical protein H8790_11925 [Oscillibacter hominis]|uniref:DUF3168 domain-containing protein n=1 Tax=Oscillibacter hominis TaxID=2763056 RepID=A0A7G9B3K0_9FIRM|nr:hypothetical protein [Oscillibacter hominis]QNL44131.1 hypothetical protein H8790_11925 [Oscillibacter hominis]